MVCANNYDDEYLLMRLVVIGMQVTSRRQVPPQSGVVKPAMQSFVFPSSLVFPVGGSSYYTNYESRGSQIPLSLMILRYDRPPAYLSPSIGEHGCFRFFCTTKWLLSASFAGSAQKKQLKEHHAVVL